MKREIFGGVSSEESGREEHQRNMGFSALGCRSGEPWRAEGFES